VACPAAADCFAVGQAGTDSGTGTLTQRWDGTAWATQRTPANLGFNDALDGITCTSANACTAVGGTFAAPRTARTLAERWNGTSWSAQPVPVPAGTRTSLLEGLSCVSASACTAVGYWQNSSGNQSVLIERWNGTAWSVQPAPDPGTHGASLSAVSCVSASACTTVGFYDTNSGDQRTLAEVWDGTAWSVQPTASPANAGSQLNGVACRAPKTCTAVGVSAGTPDSHGGTATLAEAESWSIGQPGGHGPQIAPFGPP
jgi:hypothetical protein